MALILRCGNVHTSTWITLALGAGVLLWYFDHIQFVAQSSLASSILSRSLWLVLFYSIYRVIVRPGQIRPSTDYHNRNNPRYKAMRQKLFPPGFPNGWHVVCNSEDVAEGRVKSISALGQELVAFRGSDGKVGILDAFCPHLGAHLGSGGTVVGNCIRCPFHGWSFDAEGECKHIPYMTNNKNAPPARTRTKAYPVREVLGRICVWFDAEGRPPSWDLRCHKTIERGLETGDMYFVCQKQIEFDMHCLEMHMNSADDYHFKTLHRPFPIPFIENVITGWHDISQEYGCGYEAPCALGGKKVIAGELASFFEKSRGLYFFDIPWLPVPFSQWASAKVDTRVTFEGPTLIHFRISTPLGLIMQHMTLTPVEPFKQYVECRWFAQAGVPRFVAQFLASIASNALEQDRIVWENKVFREHPLLVSGDGKFNSFNKWYNTFYSKSSRDAAKCSLDW